MNNITAKTIANNKIILWNNKFYKKFTDMSARQDLLFCDPETIYYTIMKKNNNQETFINNYKKDGFIKITFGKTVIIIKDLEKNDNIKKGTGEIIS